jgi:signal transduction histidine kinase
MLTDSYLSNPTPEDRPKALSGRAALGIFVFGTIFWLLVGLVDTYWYTFTALTKGSRPDIHEVMGWNMPLWLAVGILTPAVVWLARRITFRRGRLRRPILLLSGSLLVFLVVHGVLGEWLAFLGQGEPLVWKSFYNGVRGMLSITIDRGILFFLMIVGGAQLFDYYQRYRERERAAAALELERAQLRASLTEARLEALKMQLQPHFLFNSLNALSTLILRGDAPGAQTMVQLLSRFLRMTLDSTDAQLIPLEAELEFLDAYLKIQRVRFGERLQVRTEVDPRVRSASVPSLILQPLVENSIRHGLGPVAGEALLVLRAEAHHDRLILTVEDNGVGLPGGEGRREGMGLSNVRQRLAQLFPERHRLELLDRPGGGTIARLEFPLRLRPEPARGPEPETVVSFARVRDHGIDPDLDR